jgi:hypothetical protein
VTRVHNTGALYDIQASAFFRRSGCEDTTLRFDVILLFTSFMRREMLGKRPRRSILIQDLSYAHIHVLFHNKPMRKPTPNVYQDTRSAVLLDLTQTKEVST